MRKGTTMNMSNCGMVRVLERGRLIPYIFFGIQEQFSQEKWDRCLST